MGETEVAFSFHRVLFICQRVLLPSFPHSSAQPSSPCMENIPKTLFRKIQRERDCVIGNQSVSLLELKTRQCEGTKK